MAPSISIITATYNCSHILRYAIASVLESDIDDWELIVVGDHCTDDTQDCVEEFADQRIRYFNLPVNSGQQAKPNNFGLTKARGEFVCYLNQDDMFLPWHLRQVRDTASKIPDSIVLARYFEVIVDDEATPGPALIFRNGGPSDACPGYRPNRWQIASSWCVPLAVAKRIGPWRLEKDTFVTPSQDWLFRAWKSGVRIAPSMEPSMLSVVSGLRKNFYREKRDAEHACLFARYVSDTGNIAELKQALRDYEATRKSTFAYWRRLVYDVAIGWPSMGLGIHPNTVEMMLRAGGRGGFVRKWRKTVDVEG